MSWVGIFGILLGLAALPWAFVRPTRLRVTVFFVAFVMHILAAFIYHNFALSAPADSSTYYFDPLHWYEQGFALSTQFVIWTVQLSKEIVGGTYLDYFLVFQAFGFFGLVILMRIMEEITAELAVPQPLTAYALLFLPGLHFWTASIGKDGPLFTAVCLAIWSVMQLKRRFIQLGVALLIMLLIRPHIALVALIALALTFLTDNRTRTAYRLLLVVFALAGVSVAVATMRDTFSIDLTNADSVSDFMARREVLLESVDAGNTVVNASFPVRVLSLLFRPLFFDAEGIFALVASLESVAALSAVGYLLFHFRSSSRLTRSVTFLRFGIAFALGVTLLLGMTYYNVGLGLRQRTMIMPGLVALVVALIAFRSARPAALVAGPPARALYEQSTAR